MLAEVPGLPGRVGPPPAGVNRADVMRSAWVSIRRRRPSAYLGLEVSGTIDDIGPGSRSGRSATRCARLTGGGYAELVCVPAGHSPPGARGGRVVDAAALPRLSWAPSGPTSSSRRISNRRSPSRAMVGPRASGRWRSSSRARPGDRRRHGGPAAKLDACRDLGARIPSTTATRDFVGQAATDGTGANVILDNMGKRSTPPAMSRSSPPPAGSSSHRAPGRVRANLTSAASSPRGARSSRPPALPPGGGEGDHRGGGAEHVWPLIEAGGCGRWCTRHTDWGGGRGAPVRASTHIGKLLLRT